jgi:hypothetical protein
MLFHHKNLRPKQLSGKNFVTRLFEQAEDTAGLRAFFTAYVDLTRTLRPRGYSFDDIKLELCALGMPLGLYLGQGVYHERTEPITARRL